MAQAQAGYRAPVNGDDLMKQLFLSAIMGAASQQGGEFSGLPSGAAALQGAAGALDNPTRVDTGADQRANEFSGTGAMYNDYLKTAGTNPMDFGTWTRRMIGEPVQSGHATLRYGGGHSGGLAGTSETQKAPPAQANNANNGEGYLVADDPSLRGDHATRPVFTVQQQASANANTGDQYLSEDDPSLRYHAAPVVTPSVPETPRPITGLDAQGNPNTMTPVAQRPASPGAGYIWSNTAQAWLPPAPAALPFTGASASTSTGPQAKLDASGNAATMTPVSQRPASPGEGYMWSNAAQAWLPPAGGASTSTPRASLKYPSSGASPYSF